METQDEHSDTELFDGLPDDADLRYVFDLFYDIKTVGKLRSEIKYLTRRLASLAEMCRDDQDIGPIDEYIASIFLVKLEECGGVESKNALPNRKNLG